MLMRISQGAMVYKLWSFALSASGVSRSRSRSRVGVGVGVGVGVEVGPSPLCATWSLRLPNASAFLIYALLNVCAPFLLPSGQ
jgi:hypothetical protein